MSFTKIIIHAVWGTKNRIPYLVEQIRPIIIKYILENAKSKGIYIDRLNGDKDHLHCLFYLNSETSICKVIQLLKGESSFWINKMNLTKQKFEWADEYYAASVSESMIQELREYIDTQEEHHRKKTFQEEYDALIKFLPQG